MGTTAIPLISPQRQNQPLVADFLERIGAWGDLADAASREADLLEQSLTELTGFRYAVSCSSGTMALILALRSLELPTGAGVIVPSYSHMAVANAVLGAGLTPVLADVDEATACLSAETVEKVSSSQTYAVIAVDLFGRQAVTHQLRTLCDRLGLYLIEDGAQALGVGNRGAELFSISFNPSKAFGALGNAGAVVTDDAELATRLRELRNQGGLMRDHFVTAGFNGTIDPCQSAFLNLKLVQLKRSIRLRQSLAVWYLNALKEWEFRESLVLPIESADSTSHVWAQFAVRVTKDRDRLLESLKSRGVQAASGPRIPLHRQPLFASQSQTYPVSEKLAHQVLLIPFFPELTGKEAHFVVQTFSQCLKAVT